MFANTLQNAPGKRLPKRVLYYIFCICIHLITFLHHYSLKDLPLLLMIIFALFNHKYQIRKILNLQILVFKVLKQLSNGLVKTKLCDSW